MNVISTTVYGWDDDNCGTFLNQTVEGMIASIAAVFLEGDAFATEKELRQAMKERGGYRYVTQTVTVGR